MSEKIFINSHILCNVYVYKIVIWVIVLHHNSLTAVVIIPRGRKDKFRKRCETELLTLSSDKEKLAHMQSFVKSVGSWKLEVWVTSHTKCAAQATLIIPPEGNSLFILEFIISQKKGSQCKNISVIVSVQFIFANAMCSHLNLNTKHICCCISCSISHLPVTHSKTHLGSEVQKKQTQLSLSQNLIY